ncbi:MAG TPA: DsrE family protein [Steroidobacteraceae bacterium]|jgi:intracellular sulfur oxidation DsrE/DsrF family protein|nr:DsrE family protein [Steroidobacteraceae bacterium]
MRSTPTVPRAPARPALRLPLRLCLSLCISLGLLGSQGVLAQRLPVPSAGLPGFIAGMKEVPDPGLDYRVLFDLQSAAPATGADPRLQSVARYLNSLAEYGVPPIRRHLVVLVHGAATPLVLNDAAYAAHGRAHANPNTALIARMLAAGVQFRVCGQALLARHLSPAQLLPGVQMDLWAVSTLANLQLHGYAHIDE